MIALAAMIFSCGDKTDDDNFESKSTKISTLFDANEFENDTLNNLLLELNICYPEVNDSLEDGVVECSPKFFAFYDYNHKRSIADAFLLQVKKGVNNYPYRRLLVFVRERGQLVLVTGVVGYLVEKRTTRNGIDDLVVAVVDNIGGHYERYDVLLKYKEGKYHFEEALGDLQGTFDDEDLKKRATKMISERIKEKKLIF